MKQSNEPTVEQQMQFGSGMFAGQAKYIEQGDQGNQDVQMNTLDEPISDTIYRDLTMIAYKIKYVLYPRFKEDKARKLRNWDLWGPLLLCMMLSMTLGLNSVKGADSIFGTVFIIMWGGAAVITLNAKLLGGNVSFFQSICVLGYCVFPINVAALVIAFTQHSISFPIRILIAGLGFAWSTTSSLAFMGSMMNDEKKGISVYPIFLFYLFLSWFCIFI